MSELRPIRPWLDGFIATVIFAVVIGFTASAFWPFRTYGIIPLTITLLISTAGGLQTLRVASRRKLRRARRLAGECIHCGYDVRASFERCPECGKRVPPGTVRPPPASHTPESASSARPS